MRSIILAFTALVIAGCACPQKMASPPAATAANEKFETQIPVVVNPDFARYMTITVCYTGQKECIGPTVKNLEQANVKLNWEDFSKGTVDSKPVRGSSAVDTLKLTENQVPFTSEIRVTKHEGKSSTYVYLMLRSGQGTKRQGKVKTFEIADLSQLKETKLIDEPIKFDGGTLKAELVIGPPMTLTH